MGCLDDNVAVDFASGSLSGAQATRVEHHLATCRDCRRLVATLAPAPGERDSDLATAPRKGGRGTGPRDRAGSDPAVALGDTIGRYVVLRRLGAGGMGVVYAAYDPQLDRKIALKLLRTGIGLGEREANARLVREAQAIARLSHPNVVAVYDVGTAGTDLYLAMEFVEGDTLTHWLRRWERPWPEIVAMFVEAGRGLAAAHAVGLLHRDFKPDNVLVGADGRVRVSDFGLARSSVTDEEAGPLPLPALSELRTPLTGTGAIMGTPRYMAPEQLRGESVTAAADQFSFCVALYEALYGQHPLPGETAAEMTHGARMAPPPDSSVVSPNLATLLARGLDPQPARRFPSMTALLELLQPPPPRPRPRRLAVALASVALVGAGAAAAMVLRPASNPAAEQIRALNEQVRVEQERNRAMQGVLADYKEQLAHAEMADARRDELEQKVMSLQVILEERERKIAALQTQIELVKEAPSTTAVAVARRSPPVVVERGLTSSELTTIGRRKEDDLNGCFVEWAGRTGRSNSWLKVEFRVTPEGRVPSATVSGLDDDRIVPECVAQVFRRMRFPARDMTTVVTADAGFLEGHTTVTLTRQGIEDPPPRIDSPGE